MRTRCVEMRRGAFFATERDEACTNLEQDPDASLRTLRFASSALRMTRGRRDVGERISDPCPKENCDFCEKNDNLV